MTPLQDIPAFPRHHQDILHRWFGVSTAEAFFEQGTRNAQGMKAALKITASQLDALLQLVESHLSPQFANACRQPVVKHSRGVIVD